MDASALRASAPLNGALGVLSQDRSRLMKEQFEGQCQCGDVTYRVTGESIALFACHCTECQYQSASAFGMALWVEDYEKELLTGVTHFWARTMPSGKELVGSFCPRCGTRLFHQIAGQSKVMSVKPGTLSTTQSLNPVAHIWTQSAQRWVIIPESVLRYPGNPPDFDTIFQAWRSQKNALRRNA